MVKGRSLSRRLAKPLLYTWTALLLLPMVFVFYWMVLSSLKTDQQNINYPPLFWFTPSLGAYVKVFAENPFLSYTKNSLIISLGATLVGLLLGVPAAYSIARHKQKRLALSILVARMAPGLANLVPWFILFRKVHLLDSYTGLILSHLVITLPMVVWVMISFFEDLPHELFEAGLIDGCSQFGVFRRIAVPLTRPGMVASGVIAFIFSWNNFVFSLILSGESTKTLPVAVFNFLTYGAVSWGGLTAAATLITVPVVILTLLVQRHIVKGMTFGAVKG